MTAPFDPFAQVWLGYSQALKSTVGGLTLNVDMAATAFLRPGSVSEYLMELLGLRSLDCMKQFHRKKANKAIAGVRARSPPLMI